MRRTARPADFDPSPAPCGPPRRAQVALGAPSSKPRRCSPWSPGSRFFSTVAPGTTSATLDRQTGGDAVFGRGRPYCRGSRSPVGCDTSGRIVGSVQHADGVAVVGGDQAVLTPELCNALYRLAFKDEVTSFGETAPRDRGARARGVASPRHHDTRASPSATPFQSGVGVGVRLGLDESEAPTDDAGPARGESAASRLDSRVPRAPGAVSTAGAHDLAPSVDRFP